MAGYFYNFVIVYKKWGLVDRSYFFSNQEGSAFPVDSKSFCKSFVEAMYNGSGILRGTGRQSSARNRRPRPRSRKSLSPSLFASWTFDNLGRRQRRERGLTWLRTVRTATYVSKSLLIAFLCWSHCNSLLGNHSRCFQGNGLMMESYKWSVDYRRDRSSIQTSIFCIF